MYKIKQLTHPSDPNSTLNMDNGRERNKPVTIKVRLINKIKSFKRNKMTFQYEYYQTMEEVRKHIQECEGHHIQQCAYSTFHDALTQICFGCQKIRSSLKNETLLNFTHLRHNHYPVKCSEIWKLGCRAKPNNEIY